MSDAPNLPADIASALTEPKAYGEWQGLNEKFAWARANAPLAIANVPGFDPFWAVTRHADIMEVSRNNKLFASGIRQTTLTQSLIDQAVRTQFPDGHLIRSLVQMDAPDHMKYRLLTQTWFMPKNLRTLEDRIREIARETVDHMLSLGGECDFATDVALHYPLRVVMNILGVPREDEPRMLMLTQQLFGSTDPELNRARAEVTDPMQALQMLQFVIADFETYFKALTEDRRQNPKEDVATVLANASVNGAPIPD
ncbi:MAG: cytochrome P450, partial [Sphingomonadaceae bacterium]